ncbi:MAG: hypothetical protein P4L39_09670 [Humidesulfovibrio sp.]|nr:hypothetical protein [Humidesulfovibrio sp.]
MFDLTEVKYVKRITVGSDNPSRMCTADEIEAATALLNKCLSDTPKGFLMAIEKSFAVLQMGEHQVVLQWIVYHVGFPRKPIWLED